MLISIYWVMALGVTKERTIWLLEFKSEGHVTAVVIGLNETVSQYVKEQDVDGSVVNPKGNTTWTVTPDGIVTPVINVAYTLRVEILLITNDDSESIQTPTELMLSMAAILRNV